MHKDIFLFILLFCYLSTKGLAQKTIAIDAYLKDKIEQNLSENSSPSRSFNPSWVDAVDFRTETDEFDLYRQKYNIRVAPSTAKIRKAQTNLHQLYQDKAKVESIINQTDFIELAYKQVLVLLELSKKVALKKSLLVILEDQEMVYGKLMQLSIQPPKDWIEIQEKIAQLQIDIYQHEEAIISLLSVEQTMDWASLISVENIINYINTSNETGNFSSTAQKTDVELQLIAEEMKLEEAEQKNVLDFLQISYRGPQKDPFNEKVSVTASFKFPFSGKEKLKLEELAIEKDALQQEALTERNVNNYKIKEKIRQLNLLVKELNFGKKIMAEQANRALIMVERTNQNTDINPLFQLYQKEEQLKKELDFVKVEMSIYQEYIDYLTLTEQLFQPPFYNYLSEE